VITERFPVIEIGSKLILVESSARWNCGATYFKSDLQTAPLDTFSDNCFDSRFEKMKPFAGANATLQMSVIHTANLYPAGNSLIIGKAFTASRHAAGHDSSPGLFGRFLR
jgi:hypothetical protein